jgi:ribonuclease HI
MNGISSYILTWRKDDWKTITGAVVENLDLWRKLDEKLRDMEKSEMLVQFWRIPRDWNKAEAYAKAGAVSPLYYNRNCWIYSHNSPSLGKGPYHWRS